MSASVAIAGAGAVGRALGRALRDTGADIVCVASRYRSHAEAAAAFMGGGVVPASYSEIGAQASHVIVAVSDIAIADVAAEIARAKGMVRVALHTCGAHGPELLGPLAAAGVSCGAIHPLQTIRDPEKGAADLRLATFAVDGDSDALTWAEDIARALSGRLIRISSEHRPLYHAAAVMASNYVVALLDAAEQLMTLAGVPKKEALGHLAPLVRASVENVFDLGTAEALTGPVVRGDSVTVRRHSDAIRRTAPSIAELYRAAGLHALAMARRRGLSDDDARRIEQALLGRE